MILQCKFILLKILENNYQFMIIIFLRLRKLIDEFLLYRVHNYCWVESYMFKIHASKSAFPIYEKLKYCM